MTLFGVIFSEIIITRDDENGNTVSVIKVPLGYAAKDKTISRIESDPDIDRPESVILPRMSFEMFAPVYDADRKLPTINRVVAKDKDSNAKFNYQYSPVAYNFPFKLYIYVKNVEDGTKIIEQILPYFTPSWNFQNVKLIPELGIEMNIPVILDKVTLEDTYAGDFIKKKRSIIWTLDFTLKGYLYGPIKSQPVIKFVINNIYIPENIELPIGNSANIIERLTVRPGLTANGKPTSNIDLTVPVTEIEADDDYGFIVTKEEF